MRLPALVLASLLLLATTVYDTGAQARIVGPSDSVMVVISDWDLNANPNNVDRYDEPEFVVFRTSRDDVGEAHPDIVETGASTGLFEFTVQLETDELACRLDFLDDPRFAATGGSDPSVGVCPGDVMLVQYKDNRGEDGRSTFVDYVFEVKSWNPEFTADRVYYAPGERVSVNIYDPDANRDPDTADSLREIRVFSNTDPAGQTFSAIETSRNTGLFRLSFTTSLETQGNAILVSAEDFVTVQYVDDFPEDFASLEEDREFNFVMAIFANFGEGELLMSPPLVANGDSSDLDRLTTGQQVTLSTRVSSSFQAESVPFVSIMEVRDSDGVTVFLGWQSGNLAPQAQAEVGMSWIPEEQGIFELRTFVVSDLTNPQVLSGVVSSQVTVAAEGD